MLEENLPTRHTEIWCSKDHVMVQYFAAFFVIKEIIRMYWLVMCLPSHSYDCANVCDTCVVYVCDWNQTITATATRTSANKRFSELHIGAARALFILIQFRRAFHCKITKPNASGTKLWRTERIWPYSLIMLRRALADRETNRVDPDNLAIWDITNTAVVFYLECQYKTWA